MPHFDLREKRSTDYFEGWYFRITDLENDINMALIFAETLYNKDPHAFMQVFDDVKQSNDYLRFPLKAFSFRNKSVKISSNELSLNHVRVVTKNLRMELTIDQHVFLKKRSAMGYLSKFPLECYQEVIFHEATVKGTMKQDGKLIEISGKAYMEKTYGRRFPRQWFWLQANHFEQPLAITLAGGTVPTLWFKKFGYFLIVRHHHKEYAFGTYNLSKLSLSVQDDGAVIFTIKKRRLSVVIEARQLDPVTLVGPADYGQMILPVEESIRSTVKVSMYKNHQLLFEDVSDYAGFEWMFEA